MTNRFLFLTVAGSAIAAVLSSPIASAADLLPPPPPPPVQEVVEIRESINNWTGGYFGGVAGATCVDMTYIPSGAPDPELAGCGYSGGIVAGVNYQMHKAVFGLEGDITFGGNVATNTLDATGYKVNHQSSVRLRAGWLATDKTLFYATGGVSWMRGTMNALVGPASVARADTQTHFGYVVGGGMEHAITSNFHARLEYLYSKYNTKTYDLNVVGTCGVPCTAALSASDVHSIRVGLTYNFSLGTW